MRALLVMLCALPLLAAAPASAPQKAAAPATRPTLTGRWWLDVAHSDFGTGKKPRERWDALELRGNQLTVHSVSVRTEGDTLTLDYRYRTDGLAVNSIMGQDVRTKGAWQNGVLHLESHMKLLLIDVAVRERWALSGDGATLVEERVSELPTGATRQRLVFVRR